MKVFVTGGSGFVGSYLTDILLREGHRVIALGTSQAGKDFDDSNYHYISADASSSGSWQRAIEGIDAVVNLAGKSIFSRWTESYKKSIYESRILTTRNIVDALPEDKPIVFCSTSAVGYYGNRGDEVLNEYSAPGEGFLATVGQDWETEAFRAEDKGHRVVVMRFGIVLGKQGGAMAKMIPAFKLFAGGPLGNGRQWFPWIHIDDLVGAIIFALKRTDISGPVNFTAPEPVRNAELASTLGRVVRRPAIMPAPAFMIRLALGEFGATLLESQRALPEKLLKHGYEFKFPELEPAIRQIVQ